MNDVSATNTHVFEHPPVSKTNPFHWLLFFVLQEFLILLESLYYFALWCHLHIFHLQEVVPGGVLRCADVKKLSQKT